MTPTKRVIPALVVVAAAGMLAAVTIPALAETDQSSAPAPHGPPAVAAQLAPELLTALERDLGLDPDQALARLEKEAWATQTVLALRQELGEDRYGGAWLTEDADALMVAVTDEQAADQVRAAGADPAVVPFGERALSGVKSTLDRRAGLATDPVTGWYVDWPSNTVVVLAQTEAAGWDFVSDSEVADDAVQVVTSAERPRLLNDVRGGDPYLINNAARCSVGFSVIGGFVTAGHCALAGVTTTGADGTPQGEFVAASFPGVGQDGPDDWGVVAVNDEWFPQPVVTDFAGGTLPVAGAQEAPIGAAVCKSGSTTGVSCGVIQAKNVTVQYPEGTVTGLTQTSACAEPGDSGGAWLAGDQAQGMTSGGSGDCTSGGTTFFQPLTEVLELNELTLVTTGSDQDDGGQQEPGEDEPPPVATACGDHDFQFTGRLAAGGTQVEPNGRFYRALSDGTHTVCLAGPRSSNFDLALQKWDGSVFQTLATSTAVTSNELIVFNGSAGFYRIVVTATEGNGRYLVGLSFTSNG